MTGKWGFPTFFSGMFSVCLIMNGSEDNNVIKSLNCTTTSNRQALNEFYVPNTHTNPFSLSSNSCLDSIQNHVNFFLVSTSNSWELFSFLVIKVLSENISSDSILWLQINWTWNKSLNFKSYKSQEWEIENRFSLFWTSTCKRQRCMVLKTIEWKLVCPTLFLRVWWACWTMERVLW